MPAAELKAKYLALLKAQDKTFGYIVRGVAGPATCRAAAGRRPDHLESSR